MKRIFAVTTIATVLAASPTHAEQDELLSLHDKAMTAKFALDRARQQFAVDKSKGDETKVKADETAIAIAEANLRIADEGFLAERKRLGLPTDHIAGLLPDSLPPLRYNDIK